MTTVMRSFLGTPLVVRPQDKPIPGLTPAGVAALNVDAPRALREVLDAGRPTTNLVLHVTSDSCALGERTALVSCLRGRGLTSLANKVDRAIVPTQALLMLIDCDEKRLVLVPIRSLLFGRGPERTPHGAP